MCYTCGCEQLLSVVHAREADVMHGPLVRNQLRFEDAAHHRRSSDGLTHFEVPDRARGVDA